MVKFKPTLVEHLALIVGIVPTKAEADAAVANRDSQHEILAGEGYAPAQTDEFSISYPVIRGREQQLIDYHGGAQAEGGKSRNKIRGVSRRNPNRPIYDAAATAEFGKLPNNNPADKKNP